MVAARLQACFAGKIGEMLGVTMRAVLCGVAMAFASAALADAQDQGAPPMQTWQDEITRGFVPYHQLTVEDFKIDDQAHPESGYWVRPFMHPHWRFFLKPYGDWVYAYIDQWIVFSGLDKNESSRKSKFREMKRSLPFAQAYLDIYEIHARQLAALKPGELPQGRGATPEEAKAALQQNLDAFLKEKYQPVITETEAFVKATHHGANQKKVLELAKEIRKRLDAIPARTESPNDSTPSETPAYTAVPKPSVTPTPR
jgi:hypothetical protein